MEDINKDDFTPALWTNMFKVFVSPNVSRIAFGDAVVEKEGNFHTAIALSITDLKALGETINNMVAELETKAKSDDKKA